MSSQAYEVTGQSAAHDPTPEATDEHVAAHAAALTPAVLEALIDCLEVLTGPFGGQIARPQQATEALCSGASTKRGGVGAALALADAGIAGVLGPLAHAYWLAKRNKIAVI